MNYYCVQMALYGAFRNLPDPKFNPQAVEADERYIQAAEQLAQLISRYRQAYGSSYYSCGLVVFYSWCLSALLGAVQQHDRPSLATLLHQTVVGAIDLAGLWRLGRGIIRVFAERVKGLPPDSLPVETRRLFQEFEVRVWRDEERCMFNSMWRMWPGYSGATRELIRTGAITAEQLSEVLDALSLGKGGDVG